MERREAERRDSESGGPRFLADSMLGRLALWLRAAGYDVEYERAIDDRELLERAAREERIILTRDTLLVRRRAARARCFFVKSDHFREQLAEVFGSYGIDRARFLTRCLRCNALLEKVEKGLVRERVPPYVYGTQEEFSRCRACGRLYWAGTHKANMAREIEDIAGKAKAG